MCGIAGVYPLNKYTRGMMGYLAWEMEDRGDDSWGITNGVGVYKNIGPVTRGYKIPHTFQNGDAVTLHTRAASVGKISIENQHPFRCVGTKGTLLGVHNGGIGNHAELAKKAEKELGKKFEYEVDSHALYMYLACGGSPTEVYGTGALVWWEKLKEEGYKNTLNLLKFNTDALHVAKLSDGSLVWCSTKDPIRKAAGMVGLDVQFYYDIKGDNKFKVDIGSEKDQPLESGYPLVDCGRMVFGMRGAPYRGGSSNSGGYTHYSRGGGSTYSTQASHGVVTETHDRAVHIMDLVSEGELQSKLNEIIYGGSHGYGTPSKCVICGSNYVSFYKNSGDVPRSRADGVCGRCINDTWLEVIDALAGKLGEMKDRLDGDLLAHPVEEDSSLPLILGVTVGLGDIRDTEELWKEDDDDGGTGGTDGGTDREGITGEPSGDSSKEEGATSSEGTTQGATPSNVVDITGSVFTIAREGAKSDDTPSEQDKEDYYAECGCPWSQNSWY